MEGITLGKLAKAVHGELLHTSRNRKVTGLTIDSRKVKAGQLFVALPGRRVDGHDFVQEAMAAGACAGLVERAVGELPVIRVKHSCQALGDLGAFYRQEFPALKVVAITGSSGKTSTKEMLATILARRGHVLATEGNLNNELGLPLTLSRLTHQHQLAVLEMGMNASGEIRRLAKIAKPQVAIITNIGDAHLGNFSNKQALAKAKLELLLELDEDGVAILNADDPFLVKAATRQKQVITFGMVAAAQVRVLEAGVRLTGTQVVLAYQNQREKIMLKALGVHMAWNAAAAVAGGIALGMTFKGGCEALENFRYQSPMRLELLRIGPHRVINDAYNSNPQSAAAALQLLAELPSPGRKYVVAGSMLELGEHSANAHQELGHQVAMAHVDGLITVGHEARAIAAGARKAGVSWVVKHDSAAEVLASLKSRLSVQGDLILVKGSRGIGLEVFVHDLKNWVER